MQVLDVLPCETALQRLLRAAVCSDEQLLDYHHAQALRSVAYAASRASMPVPAAAFTSPTAATAAGGAVVLCRLCASLRVSSPSSLRAAVFLSTRLLCDAATAFGEGNERPCCTAAWSAALCSVAASNTYLHEQMSVHRRLTLGYLFVLSGTIRAVAHGCVAQKRLTSHFAEFVHQLLDNVVPCVAAMADAKDDVTVTAPPRGAESVDALSEERRQDVFQAPSRLTVEANNTLVHLFHNIALDILEVHQGCEKQTAGGFSAVLDRDVPFCMWPAVSILRGALLRTLDWIQRETIWQLCSVNIPNLQKEIQGATESLAVVKDSIDVVFTQLMRKQESLECSRRHIEQQFGRDAKDYHAIGDMMWANTLRLCFLCRSVTSAWIQIHGGAGDTEVRQSEKQVLALIASFVSSVPSLEEGETERSVFIATASLLSAAVAAVAVAPAPLMQTTLWSADSNVTQQIHNAIVQRALRYKDETVEKLSALLSRLILYSSLNSTASCAIADSADQLLELLADGRDSASQCVTGMLMRAAVERPHRILPSLFSLLQHGDTKTRRNVLDVLSALPEASDDLTYGETFSLEKMRPVLRLLSEELLLRIQDEELFVRLQSSKLFSRVLPEDVCRPLLRLAAQKDPSVKKQAAARQALHAVVDAHTGESGVVLLLLQETLALLGEGVPLIRCAPSTPADILAFATLHSSVVDDTSETPQESKVSSVKEEKSSERLTRLFILLVRRWAEGVPRWTEVLVVPFVQRVMQARVFVEQELVVRMVAQVAFVCSATKDGVVALVASCLCSMNPKKEGSDPFSDLWLDNMNTTLVDADVNTTDLNNAVSPLAHDPNMSAYLTVAPLLCLRGCSRRVFGSYTKLSDLPPPLKEMWNLLWHILLSSKYREMLLPDAQRLLLELICKYSTAMVLERLDELEKTYIKRDIASDDERRAACFVCRVGFFCMGFLLSGNKASFRREIADSGAVSSAEDEGSEMELSTLLVGAEMTGRWTEQLVMLWLLSEEDGKDIEAAAYADNQRLSQSAVECLALLVLVALNHKAFDNAVIAHIMRPLSQLTTLYREQVNGLKEGFNVADASAELLGRFEFAVQVQRRALGLLRTHSSGKVEMVCLWFEKYMSRLIELANASCTAITRLGKRDIVQVTVECCHLLFMAVMASGKTTARLHSVETLSSGGHHPQLPEEEAGRVALVRLDARDRNALIDFAVGSARYSTLPQVQSEGVKLLSALLGAAPDIFIDESTANATVLEEVLAVLKGVALMHPDARTRALAEQVARVMCPSQ